MKEITLIEVATDLLHMEPIQRHVGVEGVPVARTLLNYQVQISIASNPTDADLLRHLQPVHQCFIFGYIVGCRKVNLQHILQLIFLRRSEDQGIKILPGPKIVGYNPRKLSEMLEITSFVDAARVVCRGSQGIKILPGPKIVGHNPRKLAEMLEITSFVDAARVMCRGSQGIKTLPGPENHWL